MGLISGIATLPLAPVRGVVWVAELLYEQAQRELDDIGHVRTLLDQIDHERTSGLLSEEEAERREEEALRLLWRSREPAPPDPDGGREV